MKIRTKFLTVLVAAACVLCMVACKEEPQGRSEEEKQAITASMEAGMDGEMFGMTLGHNVVVLRLNHPAVSEYVAVRQQYYKDMEAWRKEKKRNPDKEIPEPESPSDFLCISLISDLDAAEYTRLRFGMNDSKNPYLKYTNADDDKFSCSTWDGKSIPLEYDIQGDSVRIVLRAPGYTMEQLENMQVLIETGMGIIGADADPIVDYDIPDDVTARAWRLVCEKELSDFEYAEYLKNTTEDYQLEEDIDHVLNQQEAGARSVECLVTYAYYYDESGALVDADCLYFYTRDQKEYANLYAAEDRDIGGVVGLYRSQKEITEMMQSGLSKQNYLVAAIEEQTSSFDSSYFSNPLLTSEQICNYGELGYHGWR